MACIQVSFLKMKLLSPPRPIFYILIAQKERWAHKSTFPAPLGGVISSVQASTKELMSCCFPCYVATGCDASACGNVLENSLSISQKGSVRNSLERQCCKALIAKLLSKTTQRQLIQAWAAISYVTTLYDFNTKPEGIMYQNNFLYASGREIHSQSTNGSYVESGSGEDLWVI